MIEFNLPFNWRIYDITLLIYAMFGSFEREGE